MHLARIQIVNIQGLKAEAQETYRREAGCKVLRVNSTKLAVL
jgi:hypothetical protein